jgi:ankyrin repeat protein/mono/diheme cytochrome c family protein
MSFILLGEIAMRLCVRRAMCFAVVGVAVAVQAQTAPKVDFAQDIQPLLRENCVGCHGPAKQNGGLRMDRRSSALKPLSRRIVPGSSANSFVYHRVAGSQYGQQMPPTGELKPEQVATIKAWIDQGAEWPDALANDMELPPLNDEAVALVDKLQRGELAVFMKAVAAKPALLNARGPGGATPLMYAVLYASPATLTRLLAMGADVNQRDDAGATALMWASHDLEKTRVLLAHGAQVNVSSADFRTPLMMAARRPGGAPIVKLLLEHGANTMPNLHPDGTSSPLLEAATAGDAASFALLVQHGAVLKADAENALVMAVYNNCSRCVALAIAQIKDKDVYTSALQDTAYLNDKAAMRMMLERGANPKAFDAFGRTALMYSAASDLMDLDAVKLLVAHGGDVNAKDKHAKGGDGGLTPLDMAKRHGNTEIVRYLRASGAMETMEEASVRNVSFQPGQGRDVRSAVQESLPQLQRADANFAKGSGCISCHNNSLSAMTMSAARKRGMQVDETLAAAAVATNVDYLAKSREVLYQGFLAPTEDNFSDSVVAYLLLGLNAEGYKADLNTDAAAMHILWRQAPEGDWPEAVADGRQPLCLMHIGETAVDMRALQLYAPKLNAAAYQRAVALAARWMSTAKSYSNDDRSWRVIGLAWAGTYPAAKAAAMRELLANQKADGGWSDLPSMESTAYATGKSLVALRTAGLPASSKAYQRGVAWLLAHQDKDGSWYVKTRAMGFQPSFDAGFPHGYDQFISAAGTNWAAMALTMALPETKGAVTAAAGGSDGGR